MNRSWWSVATVLGLIAVVACGADESASDPTDAPSPSDGGFELTVSPQFVNFVIPGHRPVAVIEVTGESGGDVAFSAVSDLGDSAVELVPPATPVPGVVEVWLEVPDVAGEMPVHLTIDAARDGQQQAVAISATATPGTDDLGPIAGDIAAVFLDDLAGEVEGLPDDPAGLAGGTPVAGLLVVSHYAWFTDEVEIGLAWHIMVAPDDWAELYVRHRDELRPRAAFRLSSWSTALAGGEFTVTPIDPPPDVTR